MTDPTAHVLSDPATWVDTHGDYLYNFAISRLRDPIAAEDAVQETFLAALKAKASFAGASSEKTWFVGILKNKIIDHFRKQEKEIPTDFSEQPLPFEQEGSFVETGFSKGHWDAASGFAPADWGNPAELLEKKEFWEILKSCLQTLPTQMAKVFTLRELEETETDELTKLLNISESNLFVILHRARGQMRRCIELKWTGKGKTG